MSESEEFRFDSILLALAEQHKNGVPEVREIIVHTQSFYLFCILFVILIFGFAI